MVKYLVFEANADVLLTCERGLKPAQHAREMWWMKNARLLEAFEFNRDEQARCIQGSIRQTKAREAFGIKHMAACNIQALVRGKLEMLHQKHVWQYSNMWFNPRNYSARMATFAALEANEALAAEALQLAAAGRGGGHGDAATPEFVRVTSANFRRVASLPSSWGGSAQEGRHMLVSMLQAPLRRRLRAGEWEVDLPGGIPPQNLQQYMSHNATVLAAVARRRLALMAYHTARVWLRKTGQTSHQTWANLLALGRRPLVGARRRQQDHNIEKAVAHAMQTALSTAAAAGWTVKNSLTGTTQSASTLPHMPQQEAMGGGAAGGGGGKWGVVIWWPRDLGGDKDPCRLLPMLERLLRIEMGLVSRRGVAQTVGRWEGGRRKHRDRRRSMMQLPDSSRPVPGPAWVLGREESREGARAVWCKWVSSKLM